MCRKRSIAMFLCSFVQVNFGNGIYMNLSKKLHINFQGTERVNSPFFHTETLDLVEFSMKSSSAHGKSQYKLNVKDCAELCQHFGLL